MIIASIDVEPVRAMIALHQKFLRLATRITKRISL